MNFSTDAVITIECDLLPEIENWLHEQGMIYEFTIDAKFKEPVLIFNRDGDAIAFSLRWRTNG